MRKFFTNCVKFFEIDESTALALMLMNVNGKNL